MKTAFQSLEDVSKATAIRGLVRGSMSPYRNASDSDHQEGVFGYGLDDMRIYRETSGNYTQNIWLKDG